MDLAIVVVSYNTRELLQRCLASVSASLARSPALSALVCVVDNGSADGSAAMARAHFPAVRLVERADNLGFAGANNLALRALGFAAAAGELARTGSLALPDLAGSAEGPPRHVLLLNSDAEVQGDALRQLVDFLDGAPQVGACGPQLAYPDGRFQHGAFHFPGLTQTALDLFPPPGRAGAALLDSRLNGRYPRRLYQRGAPFAVDFVLGAALAVRGAAIRQVGLLDEGYFMYCEEMDWQQRLRRAGWQVYCAPAARVLHHAGASTSQFRGPMLTALWQSRLRYFARYHGDAFDRLARALLRAGMRAQAQRARRQSPPDLAERLRAYTAISQMAARP
jgi:GT2 family glycosyltransferase